LADNKKYYYLKLKDNFFDSDEMIVLESMPDGYIYSNILLKLYLRSLKYDGRLMFNDRIPFNSTMLAQITRCSVGDIERAIKIFESLNLIEILDNGAIYMLEIQNFIGESSTEADRKRAQRNKIDAEKSYLLLSEGTKTNVGQMSRQMSDKCPDGSSENGVKSTIVDGGRQMSDKCPPEIELEIEKEIDIERDRKDDRVLKKPKPKIIRHKYGEYQNVLLSDQDKEKLMSEFPQDWQQRIERLSEYMASTGKSYKNHLATIRNWAKRDGQSTKQSFGSKVKPSEQLRDWDQYQPPVDQNKQAELDRKMAQFLQED
jgi:predicted phage replisome organizer